MIISYSLHIIHSSNSVLGYVSPKEDSQSCVGGAISGAPASGSKSPIDDVR